jgi:hypothetical protein
LTDVVDVALVVGVGVVVEGQFPPGGTVWYVPLGNGGNMQRVNLGVSMK